MIEAIIRNYLMTVLTVPVYIDVPRNRNSADVVSEALWREEYGNVIQDEESTDLQFQQTLPPGYVVIERTGGGKSEHIRSAMIAVQSYGDSKLAAATLHEQVLAELPKIADGKTVSACDLNAEYDYTDTTTKQYRYQAVFDIIYY